LLNANLFMKKYTLFLAVSIACLLLFSSHKTDEGMFPLSHLSQVDLKEAGFRIGEKDIFNPDGVALTDALVRLGGCTGSFVSDQGLIITNHHCVFGTVAGLSDKENDYLENGFYASDKTKELKTSMTCKITKSYEDVSMKILDGVNLNQNPVSKKEIIRENMDRLLNEERSKYPELSIEISEMFVGYSYTLFRYQILNDVRLVYVPPRTIGEFGGETDNWEWPKHTGDFSFVRAYVGKDGKPAAYSEDNIPYKPRKHLVVNPNGTKNEDLVFILGYPGRTYRNQPSQFIQYQQEHILPFISEWYGWRMETMEEYGKEDRDKYLSMAGTIKGLANTKKNFEGKMYGLKQTGLLEVKQHEQAALRSKMEEMGTETKFFDVIDSLYQIRLNNARKDLLLNRYYSDCGAFMAAITIENMKVKKTPKPSDTAFWNIWKKDLRSKLQSRYSLLDESLDRKILTELLNRTKALPKNQSLKSVNKIKNAEKWAIKAYESSYYDDPTLLYKMIDSLPWLVYSNSDELQKLASKMLPELLKSGAEQTAIEDALNNQLPLLLDARIKYDNKNFIPDANSTLRFTYGYIKGYKEGLNPHLQPFTHKKEIFDKMATDNVDYRVSTPVRELLLTERIAKELLDEETDDLVICMLYNMDTTGGNSGSPIMDADGKLVGVNFDRAYTATLNDYSWNVDYSRSIGVDIRYVLFTMKYLNNAEPLIKEMGITLSTP
jgi:hypothetical protein